VVFRVDWQLERLFCAAKHTRTHKEKGRKDENNNNKIIVTVSNTTTTTTTTTLTTTRTTTTTTVSKGEVCAVAGVRITIGKFGI
jgi:hypothetical protein